MADMGEIFKEGKEIIKQVRANRESKYVPLLQKAGAIYKAPGIYRLGLWDCYPTKGFARHIKTNTKVKLINLLKGKI